MAESVFGDKTVVPHGEQLRAALGESAPLWDALAAEAGGSGEWKFYTKAAGWTFRVQMGKRTLFYMLPKQGRFKLTFVYGEGAVEAARSAGLPPTVLQAILDARAYVEGRAGVLEVVREEDLDTARKMLKIKLEN